MNTTRKPLKKYKKRSKYTEQQRLLMYAGGLLLLILGLYFIMPKNRTVDATHIDQPSTQEMARAPQPTNPQSVPTAAQKPPMNVTPLSEIRPDMVYQVQGGAVPAIIFQDGTKRFLSSGEISQLPGEIGIQLEYSRDH